MAGGNIILTASGHAIVGHDEIQHGLDAPPVDLLSEEQKARICARYPDIPPEQAIALWHARQEEKVQVQKDLGAKEIVQVPQYLFHIDLQMVYLGGDQCLVHSFSETLAFLEKHESDLRREMGDPAYAATLEAARSMIDRKGEADFVDKTVHRLEKAGLRPVKCCLMLLSGEIRGGSWEGSATSVMGNGLVIEDADAKRCYVTLGAPGMNTHKDYFKGVLREQGIDQVEFVGNGEQWNEDYDPVDPVGFLNEYHGGLRCLTQKNLDPLLTKIP